MTNIVGTNRRPIKVNFFIPRKYLYLLCNPKLVFLVVSRKIYRVEVYFFTEAEVSNIRKFNYFFPITNS